jgi:hypothetical protein
MKTRDASLLAQIESDVLGSTPIADVLRKCLVLGGRSGSLSLREWAAAELKGYGDDEVPEYRRVGAPILVDAVVGNSMITKQRFGDAALPDFVREHVSEVLDIRRGVGEIEAMIAGATKGTVKLSLPGAAEIAGFIDRGSGNPYQHINAIYWGVSVSALQGILDHVRTVLTELVAELRVDVSGDEMPSASATDQAVNIAVHGKRASVSVSAAKADSGSVAFVASSETPPPKTTWWSRTRIVGAGAAGLASIVGLVIAFGQIRGWF